MVRGWEREGVTHTGAADEDHAEGFHDACDAHHPSESQEEDDTKDVLQAREVHAHEGAHAWGLPRTPASVSAAPNHYERPRPTPSPRSPSPSFHPSSLWFLPPFPLPPSPSISIPHLPSLPHPQPLTPILLPPSSIPSTNTLLSPHPLSPLPLLPPSSIFPQGHHLHWLLFSTLIVFCLFMLPTSLGQVGVVGQATEQGGHHGAGVHLLL